MAGEQDGFEMPQMSILTVVMVLQSTNDSEDDSTGRSGSSFVFHASNAAGLISAKVKADPSTIW